MSDVKLEDYLAHYGVKGMHWGVRRASGSSGGTGKTEKKVDLAKQERNRRRLERGRKAFITAARITGKVALVTAIGSATALTGAVVLANHIDIDGTPSGLPPAPLFKGDPAELARQMNIINDFAKNYPKGR